MDHWLGTLRQMLTHDRYAGKAVNISRAEVNFGEYISAVVYFKCARFDTHAASLLVSCASPPKDLPVVIWMHPLSYDSGFSEGYIESEGGTGIYFDLANSGFAVIAFDQTGFGSRGYEFNGASGGPQGGDGTPLFYRRYPHWSLLGKIVHDGLSALDLAAGAQGSYPGSDPPIGTPTFDSERIYVVRDNSRQLPLAVHFSFAPITHTSYGVLDERGFMLPCRRSATILVGALRFTWVPQTQSVG
jgi:hypothetical protein